MATNSTNNGTTNGISTISEECKQSILRCISPINKKFCVPEAKPKCTWQASKDPATSPHIKEERRDDLKIYDNILKFVGNTPLVKLNKIPQSYGLECEVFVKCEYFNPGGSVKDRIGLRMVEDAEKAGLLKPGSTIIEPTSGNTGIGLALAAAVKGYRCIIVLNEKMSNEKVTVLKALGAEIVRTPVTADSRSPEGLFAVTHKLKQQIPNSIVLDQYNNPGNPLAHYDNTAEEILYQTGGDVDMIIIGAGTGGTLTGIAKKFKTIGHKAVIVAADPEGSILATPESINKTDIDFYEVEGIGYDFIPTVLNQSVVDRWIKTHDKESFLMARRLISEEGLLCGGSSGTAVMAAMEVGKELKAGQRMVIILPDGIRNYLTKFANDIWMEERGFSEPENINNNKWWDKKMMDMPMEYLDAPITIKYGTTCERATSLMKKLGVSQLPIVDEKGDLKAVITSMKLLTFLTEGHGKLSDSIDKIALNIFPKISIESTIGLASRILQKEPYVIVLKDLKNWGPPIAILSPKDVLAYISNTK